MRSNAVRLKRMDRLAWVTVSGLALSLLYLYSSCSTTFVLDRPVHTTVIAFTCAGASLFVITRTWPSYYVFRGVTQKYSTLPLQDVRRPHSSRDTSPASQRINSTYSTRRLWAVSLLTVAALTVRIELLRRILYRIECTQATIRTILPTILAVQYYLRFGPEARENPESRSMTVLGSIRYRLLYGPHRYIYLGILNSVGWFLATSGLSTVHSTYICPSLLPLGFITPLYQWITVFLDSFIIVSAEGLLRNYQDQRHGKEGRGAALWGSIFLATSLLWSGYGVVSYFRKREWRAWMVTVEPEYTWSLIGSILAFALLVVCASRLLLHVRVVDLSSVLVMTFVFGNLIVNVFHRLPYPPQSSVMAILAALFLYAGFDIFLRMQSNILAAQTHSKILPRTRILCVVILLIMACLQLARNETISDHPIDVLMFEANVRHSHWTKQATESKTLKEAVRNYRLRYNAYPPPGFDSWYKYAKKKSSLIIDDYDQIYKDLVPFWSMRPETIRAQTRDMVSNPWNEISGISVRDGKAAVQENALPTHRWMLEGVAKIINQFAEHLPDMDLGFNLNDECRVSVPWADAVKFPVTAVRKQKIAAEQFAENVEARGRTNWSTDRSKGWKAIEKEHPLSNTIFENHSFTRNFYNYGSISCDPQSPARKERIWDTGTLCLRCVSDHSLGQFMSNWSLAADPCHQPDLANLHGFYLSPAAFKTSHELMPVFSQSKVHGYNDILYPSAWNYIDKVKYDPSEENPDSNFAEKRNIMFWRGATSEGVSAEGTWRGMARQRLVHLVNNIPSRIKQSERHTLLLPHPSRRGKFSYQHFSPSALVDLGLKASVHIVKTIVRSGGKHDGPDQATELAPLVEQSDFQHHWQYRYLFDLDGAGFSGRFLPFLQSRSLPFKTALFREWYDDRITPWVHFVPQDIRLHSVWSTLAYFAGVGGKIGSKNYQMDAHVREGALIAEKGREWAGKVLRKEDMEVYFFRLLLEWGRLTDDRRDEIGFLG